MDDKKILKQLEKIADNTKRIAVALESKNRAYCVYDLEKQAIAMEKPLEPSDTEKIAELKQSLKNGVIKL